MKTSDSKNYFPNLITSPQNQACTYENINYHNKVLINVYIKNKSKIDNYINEKNCIRLILRFYSRIKKKEKINEIKMLCQHGIDCKINQ